jgi:hypothetical protein
MTMTARILAFAVLAIATAGVSAAEDGLAFFEKRIRPLLVEHCYGCHAGVNSKGGLLLDTEQGWKSGGKRGPAIVPGKADESLLIRAVRHEDPELTMPKKGGRLSADDVAALEKWVGMGAPDPRVAEAKLGGMSATVAKSWWAFQPLPKAEAQPSPRTIDGFLDAKLAGKSLRKVGEADKRTLIRRATYDLTGLPPTPEEVDAFLTNESPDAFARLVDRLLASPQYGVRWGRHWLDVVRYADSAGENSDRPLPHAWRYRNWVFDRFNRDAPYDEFVRLQLAGDLIRGGASRERRNEGIIATGYLAIARRYGHDIDKRRYLMHEDVIDNLGKNFLGLTTGCARCHDHKYDPITAKDYYALYGIFESTRFAFPGCEPKGQPRDLVPLIPQVEVNALMKPWEQKVAAATAEKNRRAKLAKGLKGMMEKNVRELAAAKVDEGATVEIAERNVTVRKGEVLQLTVYPNGGHGADSTRVQWRITEVGGKKRSWNVEDLIAEFSSGNPRSGNDGAVWCFYESTAGPAFLTDQHKSLQDQPALMAWKRTGDALSVFVNSSDQPVKVWTTLPARSVFVHPENNRPVSIAWVSPLDGAVEISGMVEDVHPSGGDGVSFQLAHLATPELGAALVETGRGSPGNSQPDPGPKPYIPVAYAVVDAAPAQRQNARIHERGDHENLGEEVSRRWLSVFGGQEIADAGESGRRELGDWIAEHPLMARVMVNRIWQWHFGRGLVSTPNNFGSRGEASSHPELLDWLAAQFVANGYRVKPMHRLIMLTDAYRRASARPRELVEADPENRYLARFARRRLSAEEIRDSFLFVSAEIDLDSAEAHSFPKEETWKFSQHNPFNAVYETKKRSAYLMVQRQRRHPFLALFDGADPNASTAGRETSTVPTQALYFLNDPFFHAQARALAQLALEQNGDRLDFIYRRVHQRRPTAEETARAKKFLAAYPGPPQDKWSAWSRVLLASNELMHVD